MKGILQKINLLTVLLAILTFFSGWQLGHRDVQVSWDNFRLQTKIENREPPPDISIDFRLFWDTWDLLNRQYIDKKALEPAKLFYGAISGMVAAVGDPYTFFLPPDLQKSSKEDLNGSFEGVGIQLGFNKDKKLIVIAPLSGTPAQRAGIKPQDLIVKIDDQDTTNMSLPEAVKLIRGKKGTAVLLTIFREGEDETREVKLIRDHIIVKSVEVSFKQTPGKKIAILKLSRFGERTKEEWETAVSEIISNGSQGVILDLRNNPGGFLEGAVFIASEFLDGGDVVLQENAQGEKVSFKVERVGKLTKIPMVVLLNKGSASASEIVAGALDDRDRAQLVGEKSFGKGTIQQAQDLEGNTGIHITVAKWLTPKGRWVNETEGLEPDVKIEMDKENETLDPQLQKALELLE